MRHAIDRYAGTIGVALFLLIWELAARLVWRDPAVLPSPIQAIGQAWTVLTLPELLGHVGVSLGRILAGFAIAATLGVGLGLACGWFRALGWIVRPLVEVLRPIPPLAWIPLAIVWFGLGEPSKIFVIVLGAFFPIFTNAYRGMTMIPPVLFRAARTMDVEGWRLLWRVAVPAAMPDVAVGLRVGFGLAFGILVAAELIAAERGMGHLIMEARQLGHLGVSVFGIVLIGVVSLLADRQLGIVIARTVGRWAKV
ncbi:MAG: ABC transporter permease [Phreatobacter sp.]|uniref:ABC transporter permease n=1 Tax=Phreatobacter sp. TaxID=1966341 RepID=UPI001A392227|nr:ABC transporter permease [Phreatobacter sp.]MBL8571305.1 ABC transporter permease [Phreatobacter sp.]